MKKCILLFLLPLLFMAAPVSVLAQDYTAAQWTISSEQNCNGTITIEMETSRWVGFWYGFTSANNVELQYQDEAFAWRTIATLHRNPANNAEVFLDPGEGYMGHTTRHVACTWCDQDFYNITFLSPRDAMYNRPISFRVMDGGVEKGQKIATAFKPNAPGNFTVTTDECNQVTLHWTTSDNLGANPANYDIWRDGAYILNVGGGLSYIDTNVQDGQEHNYKVRVWAHCGNYGYFTNTLTGHSLPHLAAPDNLQASNDNCSGRITVTWDYPGQSPPGFQMQRSTNSTFTLDIVDINSDGTSRSYQDDSVIKGLNYFYRVRTKNSCDEYGDWTAAANGMAPTVPPAPTNINASALVSDINVTWQYTTSTETGFKLVKTNMNNGVVRNIQIDKALRSYLDSDIKLCTPYQYEIFAVNACGETSGGTDETILQPNLSQSFAAASLTASKGYYTNQVSLNWFTSDANILDHFKIYREILGSGQATVVATLDHNQENWNDLSTEAGVMYQYTIKGVGLCDGTEVFTNTVSDIGFRTASGVISGNISFEGGVAVEGAQVLVQRTTGNTGSSVLFNGSSSFGEANGNNRLNPSTGVSLEVWLKPTTTGQSFTILNKTAGTSGYGLRFDAGSQRVIFYAGNGSGWQEVSFAGLLVPSAFQQITATFDGQALRLYYNGVLIATQAWVTTIANSTASLIIGANGSHSADFYPGFMDEIRIWDRGLTEAEVILNWSRILNGGEDGLMAYWRADENLGNWLFDASRTGSTYHENHAFLTATTWSQSIPTDAQLGLKGITDASGNYIINNIRYSGTGNNFTITPFFGQHSFDPSSRVLFIGEGAEVHNNQDFKDNSSFIVTGFVKYLNRPCYEPDVFIYIDGSMVVQNGNPVVSDENGAFTVSVPIGNHIISVARTGHTFVSSTFPDDGTAWNFQQALAGPLLFKDNTLITVVGRVVGGTLEGDKKPGMGLSVNNIGQARITFTSQRGNGCTEETIWTDQTTGEYTIQLPPLKYIISTLNIQSNPAIVFSGLPLLDLSQNPDQKTAKDTVYVPNSTVIDHIDSVKYHVRKDYIYRVGPELSVTNTDGSPFNGDQEAIFVSLEGDTIRIDLIQHPFPWPIFTMNTLYRAKISVFERYVNKDPDPDVEDLVPVTDGIIKINNGLSKVEGQEELSLANTNGTLVYSFQGGFPNPNTHAQFSEYDFTKLMQIDVETGEGGSITTSWLPNTPIPNTDGDTHFRAYMLGSRPKGNNFTTVGPQMVDFILRDPPGSNSYAYLEKDSSFTTVESWESNFGETYSLSRTVMLGVEFGVGGGITGPMVEMEFTADQTLGLDVQRTTTSSGELVSTYSFHQTMQTADDDNYVGRDADLFMGKSRNIVYGLTDNIVLLPDTVNPANVVTTGVSNQGFKITRSTGMFADPSGFATFFLYSQYHIETEMIPSLELLRNQFFANNPAVYHSYLDPNDPNYGTNNDDPLWGAAATSADYVKTETADFNGPSYSFIGTPAIDSVRWYNQQIRLWKEALAKNEKEKLEARLIKNVSYDAGANLQEQHTYAREESSTSGWEVHIDESMAATMGLSVGGAGFEVNLGLAFNQTEGRSSGTTVNETTTIGYALSDPDQGDFFSLDVLRPRTNGGLVFKTKGGQSKCPFEDKAETKYYQIGTVLSEATLQREKPKIDVAPVNLYSVPEDEAAEFLLTLSNESASDDDMWYTAQVVEGSNPNGAIIQIDGESPNRTFFISGGASITKRLTVRKGAVGISDYDDLQLILKSSCEYTIADTTSFSVHFVPSCTDINVISPADQWVANYSNNDTLRITVGGYNINNDLFQKFEIQYKPKNSSTWVSLASYYKDLTGITDPNATLITVNDQTVTYAWDLAEIVDGEYQIRATTTCPLAGEISDVMTGIIDRVNPHPFGTPQPADGVLQPNDEILIQFNEKINGSLLTRSNFDIRGVLNGTQVSHGTSLYFDGTAQNYMNIPEGVNLQNKSFTLEIWAQRSSLGEAYMLSQGTANVEGIAMGFDAQNRFTFTLAGHTIFSDQSWVDLDWHHWVVSYNHDTGDLQLFRDGSLLKVEVIPAAYHGTGKIQVGKCSFGDPHPFNGNLHEFRIWNTFRTQSKIVEYMNVQMNGLEQGLIGNWRMNEAFGELAEDIVHYRNASIHATWSIFPAGKAFLFDGADDFLEMNGSNLSCTVENDLTIEFWFKGASGNNIGLLSNGTGDLTGSPMGWAIRTDATGRIQVFNQGLTFTASDETVWDNTWHHFALVVSRIGNINSFVDGSLQYSQSSSGWGEFGGARLWAACRGWYDNTGAPHQDLFFNGKMDEIRVWKTARKQEQIQNDMNHRLSGDEFGLWAYYPFESYVEVMGVMTLQNSLDNQLKGSAEVATATNGADFTAETPNIKLKRPVQSVNYTWAFNEDKIILTPTDPSGLIENTILDITVKDVQDLYQNRLQSPVTWTAFIDRNQVKWEDERLNFEKILYEELEFDAVIVNSGGNQQAFSIDNLPNWLTAVPQSGTLQPVSTQSIHFIVNPSVPIGHYSFDAYLHTNFNFDEKLLMDVRVFKVGPTWDYNPSDFEYTMNVVGQLSIDGILSNDIHDRIAAFINGECRGAGNLQYIPQFDIYEVYLDIFSHVAVGEPIELRVWNASEGVVHTDVNPDMYFVHNSVLGLPATPIQIEAFNTFEQIIPVSQGWNWVSFNLQTADLSDLNIIMRDLEAESGSLVKGQMWFDAYSPASGWNGSLSLNGGLLFENMYKVYVTKDDSIIYIGSTLNPATTPIHLTNNWNWIGFTPNSPMPLSQALGFYNAQAGDLIKSQTGFSIYDSNLGWIGSLNSMQPNQGYMMKVSQASTFYYPESIIFGAPLKNSNSGPDDNSGVDPSDFQFNMSVIAKVISTDPLPGDYMKIKVWSGNELRGMGAPVWDESRNIWLYYLTVYGFASPETLGLTAIDTRTGERYSISETISYAPDMVHGSYLGPVPLHLAGNISGTDQSLMAENSLKTYPNPFNESLRISYTLNESSWVRLEVFDALGQKVCILQDEHMSAGLVSVTWNGNNSAGSKTAEGLYTISLITNKGRINQRIVKTSQY